MKEYIKRCKDCGAKLQSNGYSCTQCGSYNLVREEVEVTLFNSGTNESKNKQETQYSTRTKETNSGQATYVKFVSHNVVTSNDGFFLGFFLSFIGVAIAICISAFTGNEEIKKGAYNGLVFEIIVGIIVGVIIFIVDSCAGH